MRAAVLGFLLDPFDDPRLHCCGRSPRFAALVLTLQTAMRAFSNRCFQSDTVGALAPKRRAISR
jgi:hypothetical protein